MSARTIAIQAAIRAIDEAETDNDDDRAAQATQRSLAWSAIAANLHADVGDDFVTRLLGNPNRVV